MVRISKDIYMPSCLGTYTQAHVSVPLIFVMIAVNPDPYKISRQAIVVGEKYCGG
jgi:hypothetical protein